MRVISGTARGKKLKSPEGQDVRPTLDRIKEDMFNIIGPAIRGKKVLDLFAGSGALGIEALSRGAEVCYFVDRDKKSLSLTRQNLASTQLTSKARLLETDAENAIKKLSSEGLKFDYIFIDPPYNLRIAETTLQKLQKYNIIQEKAFIILETELEEVLPDHIDSLVKTKDKKYKNTRIVLLTKEQKSNE